MVLRVTAFGLEALQPQSGAPCPWPVCERDVLLATHAHSMPRACQGSLLILLMQQGKAICPQLLSTLSVSASPQVPPPCHSPIGPSLRAVSL